MGFAGRKRDEIVSAVFEACANALIHGRRTSDEAVTLTIRECDDCLEAIVNDRGKGFSGSNGSSLPRPTADRGRGIPLMRAFMDEVYYDFSEGCTVVLRKILPKD
jgi:anti-sigma regulatory factor (Ser/Thr protein kinase)